MRRLLQFVFSFWGILFAVTACNTPVGQWFTGKPAMRVLFIGNSFTAINGGLDKQLEGLAPSISTISNTASGYTLARHWAEGNAAQTIRQGGWKYVVLQEQSQTAVTDQKNFFEAVRKFDAEIRRVGAMPILLMTWERPDSTQFGVTTANVASAYQTIGRELVIPVAPAGLAFARSLRDKPSLGLYIQDGHPTTYGTYLAACVLYGTIFRTTPVGNSFADGGITAEQRAYLQQVAAEMLGF